MSDNFVAITTPSAAVVAPLSSETATTNGTKSATSARAATGRTKKARLKERRKIRQKLIPARLGDKLRRIRLRLNLTQCAILPQINPAESGANRARVSQYERGVRSPSLIEIFNYAKLADISLESLLDDRLDLPF